MVIKLSLIRTSIAMGYIGDETVERQNDARARQRCVMYLVVALVFVILGLVVLFSFLGLTILRSSPNLIDCSKPVSVSRDFLTKEAFHILYLQTATAIYDISRNECKRHCRQNREDLFGLAVKCFRKLTDLDERFEEIVDRVLFAEKHIRKTLDELTDRVDELRVNLCTTDEMTRSCEDHWARIEGIEKCIGVLTSIADTT